MFLRNLRDPRGKIFDSEKGTLLGSVLWSNGEPKQVNYFIKNILKLYTNYIRINFPQRHTHILGVSLFISICLSTGILCHFQYLLSATCQLNLQYV